MSLTSKIRPVNEKHSIKEAVLSLFLPNPIIKPERFKDLINSGFKDTFQQFEPIAQFVAEIKNEKGVLSNSFNLMENIGFKFSSFKSGKLDKVLQALNQSNRYLISYHDFNYTRWADYFGEFKKIIQTVSEYESSQFINAFSLHYVDQFEWIEDSEIDSSIVFNKQSKYLPKHFFEKGRTNYVLMTERVLATGSQIFDRIEIKIEPVVVPVITISHNITHPLSDFHPLSTITQDEFVSYISAVHEKNKGLLKDLLLPEVCSMIGI